MSAKFPRGGAGPFLARSLIVEEDDAHATEADTVNSEIFAIILFSRIALKDILATFKIRNLGMIYLYISKIRRDFAKVYFHETSHLRENKTLAKICEFTVT